jgi:hypothetical protein
MSEQTGEYTKTSVGIDTQQLGRAPRRLFAVTLLASFLTMAVTSFALSRYRSAWAEVQAERPTLAGEVVLWVSQALQHPLGMGVSVFACVTVLLLGLKGLLDRFLKLLIGLNVIWLGLFVTATVFTWTAVLKLADRLKASP